jgi:cytochrome c5
MAQTPHVEEHQSFIKSPQQLAVVVFLAFAVPIVLIVLLTQLVTGAPDLSPENPVLNENAVAKRIKPVGDVVFADAQPAAAAVAPAAPVPVAAAAPAKVDGKAVYDQACSVCHAAGIAGAPKSGDKGAWSARVAQGKDTLYKHAIEGIRGMPAKGGNASLADAEVKAAVDVLIGMVK